MTGIISSSSPFLGRAFDDKRNDNAKRKEARTGIRQELSHWRLSKPVLVALDDHWETWCRLNEYSCKATPFASTGNMISADWLKWLMNCGHMVSGHLTAGTRETWDAWLALLRGINSSEITPELIAKLSKQEERALRPLLKQHLPPNHRTFVFHLLPHIIRDVEYLPRACPVLLVFPGGEVCWWAGEADPVLSQHCSNYDQQHFDGQFLSDGYRSDGTN
jgi:hypothetical protein